MDDEARKQEEKVMWLFTRYGFYSVACARKADGSLDFDIVMIRARRAQHLRNLQSRCPWLADTTIVCLPGRDYRYRLIVPKGLWIRALTDLADEQQWSNFKSEAADHLGVTEAAYSHALHKVWSVMHQLQAVEMPKGGLGSGSESHD